MAVTIVEQLTIVNKEPLGSGDSFFLLKELCTVYKKQNIMWLHYIAHSIDLVTDYTGYHRSLAC